MSTSSKIDALPALREVVENHGLWADKNFGQNFLFDLNITRKIAHAAGDLGRHTVFEIGPGPGGLTRALLSETKANVIAIEKDRRFIKALHPLMAIADGRLQLVEGDALKISLPDLASPPRSVIANLPYNIGTELLISWLHQSNEFSQFILMFQKEVAQRIVAKPNSKAYGRLSILCQVLCDCRILFHLPPSAFTPQPKVTSSVVLLRPRPDAGKVPIAALEQITMAAFGQRRKMLRQSLKNYLGILEQAGIDPQRRAETLSVGDFIKLAEFSLQK